MFSIGKDGFEPIDVEKMSDPHSIKAEATTSTKKIRFLKSGGLGMAYGWTLWFLHKNWLSTVRTLAQPNINPSLKTL